MRFPGNIFLSLGCNFFQYYLHEFLRILIFPRVGQNQVSSRPLKIYNHSNRRSSTSWVDPAYSQVEMGPPHLVAKRIACCRQKNWYKTRIFQKMVDFDIFSIDCQKTCTKSSAAEVQITAFPLGALIFFKAKKWPRMCPGRVIVRTSLSDELYFFQWPKSGPGSSRVERHYNWLSCSQTRSTKFQ